MCELRGNHVALLSIFTHPKSCHWDTGTANLWPCACPYGLCWKLHRWSRFLFGINWLLSSYCSCFLNVLARDIVTASVLTHGKQDYSYMEKLSFNWLNITYGNLIVLTSKIATLHHYRLAVLTYDHYFKYQKFHPQYPFIPFLFSHSIAFKRTSRVFFTCVRWSFCWCVVCYFRSVEGPARYVRWVELDSYREAGF